MSEQTPPAPRATYRLQLGAGLGFREIEGLLAYLDDLGVSHVYASPFLRARTGSSHGYDIVQHDALNPEIGDRAGLGALGESLAARGMGLMVDFVPNHMGVGKADNPWWLDVLEWGRASPFAEWFDIEWQPAQRHLRGKVLLPTLGDHYGRVLEAGELVLRLEPGEGRLDLWYHEHRLPVGPRHYARVLALGFADLRRSRDDTDPLVHDLGELITGFGGLRAGRAFSAARRASLRARAAALRARLAERYAGDAAMRAHVDSAIAVLNGTPGEPRSFAPLHRLLERQAYRPAFWRVATEEINYRRFFDISDLAAIRVERDVVFDAVHALLLELVAAGLVQGIRLDHVDGLLDPRRYCERLAARVRSAGTPPGQRPWIVVEKILAEGERLRDWPVSGTTGYDFLALVTGLLVDPAGRRPLERAFRRFTGVRTPFSDVEHEAKCHVMDSALSGELTVLARDLERLSETHWLTRDFTRGALRAGLREVVACFRVYRTYVDARGATAEDRLELDLAVLEARRRCPELDPSLFDFLQLALSGDRARARGAGFRPAEVLRLAMRVQQFTSPVMAKGVEDTTFYRYPLLLALNEVGGDPGRFSVDAATFHRDCRLRAEQWPRGMLATATHDTKRGEDTRARIAVLSEMAREWEARVRAWARMNRRLKRQVHGRLAPSRVDEYLLYQSLLGIWPAALTGEPRPEPDARRQLAERLEAYMVKAAREAKQSTSWLQPDAGYEAALGGFVRGLLDLPRAARFLDDFVAFQALVARRGVDRSLVQTVLKLTCPGVPDLYQGSELWDLSLVDPDNRRPADLRHRSALLARLRREIPDDDPERAERVGALYLHWRDGAIKLYVIERLLGLRRALPELFVGAQYLPLEIEGEGGKECLAFARRGAVRSLVVVVRPRGEGGAGTVTPDPGAGPRLEGMPGEASAWTDVLTGRRYPGGAGFPGIEILLSVLPAAVLVAGPPVVAGTGSAPRR